MQVQNGLGSDFRRDTRPVMIEIRSLKLLKFYTDASGDNKVKLRQNSLCSTFDKALSLGACSQ